MKNFVCFINFQVFRISEVDVKLFPHCLKTNFDNSVLLLKYVILLHLAVLGI